MSEEEKLTEKKGGFPVTGQMHFPVLVYSFLYERKEGTKIG